MNKTCKDEVKNTSITQAGEAPPVVPVSERGGSEAGVNREGAGGGEDAVQENVGGIETEELSKIVEVRVKGTNSSNLNSGEDVRGAAPPERVDNTSVISTDNLEEGCAGWDDIIQKATNPTIVEAQVSNGGQQSSHALAIGVVEIIPGAYAVAPEGAVADNSMTQNSESQSPPPEQEKDIESLTGPGLVSAFPVPVAASLPRALEVDVGEETAHEAERKARTKRLTFVCGSLGLVMLLMVVLLLVFLRPVNTTMETDEANDEEGLERETEFQLAQNNLIKILPSYTVDAIESSSDSPPSLAYQWLRNDTALASYPEWRLIQRFALATFFYATEGPKRWKNNTHWLSYDHDECDWFAQSHPGCKDMTVMII